MKKITIVIFLSILLISCLTINVYSDDLDKYIEMLDEILPENVKDQYVVSKDEVKLPGFNEILSSVFKEIRSGLLRPMQTFASLLFIITVASLYHCFGSVVTKTKISRIFDCVCNLCITLSFINISFSSIDVAYDFIKQIADLSMSLFPIISGVSIVSGNINEATVMGSGLILFVSICQAVMCNMLVPILKFMCALTICSCFDNSFIDLSGFVKFLKGIFSTVLSFCMMLFGAVLSYQSIVSSAKDSLSIKTIKFTAGSAIPIVGASVGEALKTIGGALSLLKSIVGGVGVSVVLLLLLPCVLILIIDRIALSAGAACSKILGCKREAKYLESMVSVYGFIIALICVCSFMLIFILTIFAATACALGGG